MFIVTSQRPGFILSGCTLLSAKRIVAEASTAPSKISFRMTSFSRFWVHSPHLLGPRHGIHLRTTFHRAGPLNLCLDCHNRSRDCAPLHALRFLPRSPNLARYVCNGSWNYTS